MNSAVQLGVARVSVATLNHLLGQHAWARDLLAKHVGKTLRVVSNLPSVPLLGDAPKLRSRITDKGQFETFSQDANTSSADVADVDIALNLTPDLLFRLLSDGPKTLQSSARISGDVELAMVLGQLLTDLRWDPAEDLHRVLGPAASQFVVDGVRQSAELAKDLGEKGLNTVRNLAVSSTLVERSDMDSFQSSLRQLRETLDRLDARVAQMEKIQVQ